MKSLEDRLKWLAGLTPADFPGAPFWPGGGYFQVHDVAYWCKTRRERIEALLDELEKTERFLKVAP